MKNITLTLSTLLFLFLLMEITLQFLPVNDVLHIQSVNEANPTFKAEPNRNIQFSKEWNFRYANKKHVNNHGFVNPHDYVYSDSKPLVAFVGDSYIEALHIPDDKTYYERLAKLRPNYRFYSFGFSGGALSEYLIWAKHAKKNYNNDYLVINVVGNDFDESLKKYLWVPGFYHYVESATGALELKRHDRTLSTLVNYVTLFSTVRYAFSNLQLLHVFDNLKAQFNLRKASQNYVGNVRAHVDSVREQDSYKVIDAFFRDLPTYAGLEPKRILLVIDAMRGSAYHPSNLTQDEHSYFGKMRTHFIRKAHQLGYGVMDMQKPFTEHFKKHHQHFEFVGDGHWNPMAHGVVADAIQQTDWWQSYS